MVQAARLLGIVLIIQSCYTGESSKITVKIDDNNYKENRPSTFDPEPPYYRAGTPLKLTCRSDIDGRAFYHWTSNCSMNCFVKDALKQNVSTDFLKSTDSGNHTCSVTGSMEEEGSDSIIVHVVGAGIYDSGNEVALPNNSLILAGTNLDFTCVSGSDELGVGIVIDNDGDDVSEFEDDPFFTFTRTTGAVHVKSSAQFDTDHQGIYTCIIPDDTGSNSTVHVGLYPSGTNVKLAAKMEIKAVNVGLYIVNCTSTHSPATTVTWMRNGAELDTSKSEGMYTSYQEVKEYNRRYSTYHNVLTIRGDDATGEYRCDIENRYEETSAMTRIGKLQVTGHETPLIVNVTRRIRCTSFINSTIMMWSNTQDTTYKNGSSPNLDLDLTPRDVSKNNTHLTCKAWVPDYNNYVRETVLIQVRDLYHNSSITSPSGPSGPYNPWLTDNDEPYTLTCLVFAEVTPEVKWMDPEGMEVMVDDARSLEKTVSGMYTTLKLTFNKLNSSHAGRYCCISTTSDPPTQKSSHWNVTIKLPSPIVTIDSVPDDLPHYTGFNFTLGCYSQIDQAVDTDVTASYTWSRASRLYYSFRSWSDTRVSQSSVSRENSVLYSYLYFTPLQKRDDYFYSCESAVYPSTGDPKFRYLVKSESESAKLPFDMSPFLKTKIIINYTSPDLYLDYAPSNYRAASSVILNCTTEGEEGRVSFSWSSICPSCYVSGSRLITRDFLRTRDMRNPKCTAYDRSPGGTSIGSDNVHMNIVGAGIYVEKAQYYYGTQRAQPNNTHISIYSGPRSSPGNSYSRFVLWCCSNSTKSYVGSITDPNGITYTSSFKDLRLYRYSRGSSYGGCIRLEGYRHYAYPLNYDSGVYSCNIPDASGKNHTILFGLYNNDTRNVPSIYYFHHVVDDPTSVLTLICVTKTAPPTEITWQKNGMNITDDNVTLKTLSVTDRNSSTYVSTISIRTDNVLNHIATYTVIVGNSHGYVKENRTVEGIKITPSEGEIVNGIYYGNLSHPVTFDCSSDLSPMKIRWYNGNNLLSETVNSSSRHESIDIISTDHHEEEYKCKAISSTGSQEAKFKINVRVSANHWADVKITDPTHKEPLHGSDHMLLCTVNLDPGLNIEEFEPEVHWYHPDGTQVEEVGRVREGENVTTGSVTTGFVIQRMLHFSPVLHDDGGEYTCKAVVSWMPTEPVSETYKMVVTTQAYMQLRIEALTHCSTWEHRESYHLEKEILKNIEDVVQKGCNCDFDSSEIHSGEFSCRTKRDAVTYRAIINGSSEILSANETLDLIDDWKTSESTMLYRQRYSTFRLQLTSSCPISFKTFSQLECTGDEERACDKQKGDMLFNSDTCYTFKSCDDGSDDGSG